MRDNSCEADAPEDCLALVVPSLAEAGGTDPLTGDMLGADLYKPLPPMKAICVDGSEESMQPPTEFLTALPQYGCTGDDPATIGRTTTSA
jgi:hypothetical protein